MINFIKKVNKTRYYDPTKNFELNEVDSEKRYDPLTGKMVRIFPFRKIGFPKHDWTPFVEESRKRFCPFCPDVIEKTTPRFPEDLIPEGRLRVGDAVLVPNLHPFETHTGVVVMTSRHYLAMDDITPEIMACSIEAGLQYLKRIEDKDPENAGFSSVNWNYMPYAGGSLIHPHMQVIAGADPACLDGEMARCAAAYFDNHGSNYWHDLVEAEKKEGQRYIGSTGGIEWLATFAPLGMADVTAVLVNCRSFRDVSGERLVQLTRGLKNVISYYNSVNIPAFNMATYFAGNGEKGFCCTMRVVGRYTLFPLVGSDVSHMQMLHLDPWTLHLPEVMAEDLRNYFK
ncbi:MAG: hypothetical protein ACOY4I_14755 [Bacillota bacterium]